jgi:hypothetical protein
MKEGTELHVVVHYPAAEEPFQDKDATRTETVGQLKGRVLTAFGLTEGQGPDNTIISYTLHHGKVILENLDQTLGEVAGDHKVLQLKLSQQITQGT